MSPKPEHNKIITEGTMKDPFQVQCTLLTSVHLQFSINQISPAAINTRRDTHLRYIITVLPIIIFIKVELPVSYKQSGNEEMNEPNSHYF